MVKLVEMEFLRKKKKIVGMVVRLDVVEMDELMSYSQRDRNFVNFYGSESRSLGVKVGKVAISLFFIK